jgi:hypothetical protein
VTSKRQRDKESCAGCHEKRTSTLVNDGMASRLKLARRWPEWQSRKWLILFRNRNWLSSQLASTCAKREKAHFSHEARELRRPLSHEFQI